MPTKTIFEHMLDWFDTVKELEPDEVKGIFYPKKEHIISLHDYLIKHFKYRDELEVTGIRNDGPLDFIGLKYYVENKENRWENLIYRGANIFDSFLAWDHPFYDGNKRTGFVTLWIFLRINNFKIKFRYFDFHEHLNKFRKWASNISDNNIYEISIWIKENETFFQKLRRCLTDFLIKIKKLIFRQFSK